MPALLDSLLANDYFDVGALFVLFALPAGVGFGLLLRDTRRALREGKIGAGRLGGEPYVREHIPSAFWTALVSRAFGAIIFLSFPLLIFCLFSWPHLHSIFRSLAGP